MQILQELYVINNKKQKKKKKKTDTCITFTVAFRFYGDGICSPYRIVQSALKGYLGIIGFSRLRIVMEEEGDSRLVVRLEDAEQHFAEVWAGISFSPAVGGQVYRASIESYKLEQLVQSD